MTESPAKIPEVFESIGKTITPDLINSTQAVFQFNFTGKEEGVWHVDLNNGEGGCGEGEPQHTPDAIFTIDSDVFAIMFAGKLHTIGATMRIEGDLEKASKLEKILKKKDEDAK